MTSMLRDVKHPRDDLVETLRRLKTLTAELDVLNDESAEQDQRLARLEQGLPQAGPRDQPEVLTYEFQIWNSESWAAGQPLLAVKLRRK
jgi:hypothetical protein